MPRSTDNSGRTLRLHSERFPGEAVLDTAISHAMLRRVANGTLGESLRLYRPDNVLLFSSLDARRPGYPLAVERAAEAGFESVIRLAGGHAAVFLEESMAFAWASADPDAHLHITPRFEKLTSWIVSALRGIGLDARIGAVPGEYCPGEYSINLAGRVKVMGVGQRVIRGGAHVGGVLTVAQTGTLREVLIPVYEALGLEFEPESAGGLADFEVGLTPEVVIDALRSVLSAEGYDLQAAPLGEDLQSDAVGLMPLHTPVRDPNSGKVLRSANHVASTGAGKVVMQGAEAPTPGGRPRAAESN